MRKIYILGLALFAVFAFSAVAVSSASALESVWLVSGVKPAVAEPADIEGELWIDILNEAGTTLLLEFHCSGIFKGNVGPGKLDEINDILALDGVTLIEALGATNAGLSCEVLASTLGACDNAEKLIELWPDNLPWPTEIVLVGSLFTDLLGAAGKEPGFDFLCLTSIGTTLEGLCEGMLTADLENLAEDVLGTFLEEAANVQECTPLFGEKLLAKVTGEGLILLESGLTLAVSEG